MPRATENDPLPYESPAFQAAIARRVAQMEAKDRCRGAKRKASAIALAIAILWMLWSIIPAHAYDTGKLNCTQIGKIARGIVESKHRGASLQDILAVNMKVIANGHTAEAKIIEDIATQIFTGFASGFTEDGAQIAYYADCAVQK
jgi:hypothetical protein